jgi:hypothetical protein
VKFKFVLLADIRTHVKIIMIHFYIIYICASLIATKL